MAAIAKGDGQAMHVLYARHNARVYRFVVRMTRNTALAEDLVSDVFIDVWRRASQFEHRAQVSTWILAIARFKAITAMRRRQPEEADESIIEQIEDPTENAEALLEKADRIALLRDCLTRLSPVHREIIDLVYYHEKSIAEASTLIGIPQATVKTRMFYARKQLGTLLRQAEMAGAPA
jgi:RNA polymerase sigma-70 factor (ECF subfamily)